LLNQVIVGFV